MADETSRGFRKFILDPKSSVMTYIADNISSEHPSYHSGKPQNGPTNGLQPHLQPNNRLQQENQIQQNQSQNDFMRPPLTNRPSQSNSQASSPQPSYAQPMSGSQMGFNTPYIASNVSSQGNQGVNEYAGAQSQLPSSQSMSNLSLAQEHISQPGPQGQYPSNQSGTPSALIVGQGGPPQPGPRRRNPPQSAPRLYHRMMLEFEMTKKAFFLAKSRKSHPISTLSPAPPRVTH